MTKRDQNSEMTKRDQNYGISLDIGIASDGWCVVDENYRLLKHKGKSMWGVRLFDEAKTAKNRRVARGTHRRLARRRERIALLKQLMGSIVLEVDPNFFMRMEKGYQTKEDKGYTYNLFIDDNFNDNHFYEKYPTIYHLRKDLCTSADKADPRLIYLALHHIVKYRGNFLYEGQNFSYSNASQVFDNFKNALSYIFNANEYNFDLSDDDINATLMVLMNNQQKKSVRKDQAIKILSHDNKECKKFVTDLINLLLGYESNITKIFPKRLFQEDDKDFKTNFSSSKFEDEQDKIEAGLQEDYETLLLLHNVYSFFVLHSLMVGQETLYDAMIAKYNAHKDDLAELKSFLHTYFTKDDYRQMFRDENTKGNYYAYINDPRTTSKVEFYAFVKKMVEKNQDAMKCDAYKNILNKIDLDSYMPKQTSKDNGAIPYQLHQSELEKILEQQGKFYPVLKEQKNHIMEVFHFRVPYYVGPLNPHTGHDKPDSPFAWIKRREEGKIYPWNFNDKVDEIASAEAFIRRMTNTCSYLIKEEVVPKKSLLYSRYEVLNELNKIRIKGKLLDPAVKKDIINEVFLEYIKVTTTDIWEYCIRHQLVDAKDEMQVEGTQKENEFASSLESWIHFKKIYGDEFFDSLNEIERIIEWITVYEDKKILEKRINKEFPKMSNAKLKQIVKKRYSGWGRLSRRLLCDLRVQNQYGEFHSIMDCLENTQMNFMQIIHDKKLGFHKLIERELSFPEHGEITYEDIDILQGSPALKKGIWQTVLIVKEIIKVMGHNPSTIFIEFARSEDEKKRTDSKVKKLIKQYEKMKETGFPDDLTEEAYNSLSKLDKNSNLNNERLYLYYIQQGKCMYSGKPLDIDKLSTYQIDHIIPQSYIKDDSIDNKVLVLSNENQYKGDKLLIPEQIIRKQMTMWKQLYKAGLISQKKLNNLTCSKLSDREEMGFINRQLVETRQITKHVANLFKNAYEDVNIVTIKAGLSYDFRKKFHLYKVREINDYHHAQDAYLASVIGTFVMKKYPILQKEFIFTEFNQIANFRKDLDKTAKSKYGFIINQMSTTQLCNEETGEVFWDGQNTLNTVLKAFEYKDCFITKKLEEGKGLLFNLTIKKNKELSKTVEAGKLHKIIPVNKLRSDVRKYGGFTGLEYAYGIAISYPYKKKIRREVVNVPRFLVGADSGVLLNYLKAETGSEEITIIKDKILFNQLMEIEGSLVTMASANEWNNARQLLLSKYSQEVLYLAFHNKDVSDEDYFYVYDEYVKKLDKFYPQMHSVYVKLIEKRDAFMLLEDKADILKKLLVITKANGSRVNINDDNFKIASAAGRMSNKTIDLDKTTFIAQSVTGLYSKKYKL